MRIPLLLTFTAALALAACGDASNSNAVSDVAEAEPAQWSRDLEKQLMAALDEAPKHGLTRDLFLKGELSGDDGERNRELSRIALGYASALANGKVDPAKLREA
ncbi:MAG TPA: hypothetical protein VFU80_05200, partial [Sphingomicrobium sp.]|nr:hypothetical protein [Sphingomicrobium sp.]